MRLPALLRFKPLKVKGYDLPGPRFTVWAWYYFLLYVAAPILAIGLVLDMAFYLVFDQWFGTCYALFCFFD